MAIASRSAQCLKDFEDLVNEAQHSEGESSIPAAAVGDELGRFKIWAGNIGALQRDSRSLDYRLRDASQVGDQVTKILQDLNLSLCECIEIVSGRRAQKQGDLSDAEAFNDEFSDISDSDGSEDPSSSASGQEPVSELSQLLLAIKEAITSLYKLSITIRKPTPRDRYAKAASSTPFDASYDVGHVYEKFPHVRSKAWLIEKLGKAITRRREFLRYRSQHREKIGGNIRPSTDFNERHELADSCRKVASNDAKIQTEAPLARFEAPSVSHSQLASTKATTYVANLNDENLDMRSTADRSETSYVTSIAEDNSHSMRQIPDPPKESANGMPFECPYCFTILAIKNMKHWKKHVLSDLQPYLCTFEGCSTQMFQSRYEWFQHELDKHRKEWRCCLCSNEINFSSAAQLEVHLNNKHSEYGGQQTSALLSLCEKSPENISLSACPFCASDSSGSVDLPYFISMAATSLSSDYWNPCRVLDVNPKDPNSTCVGIAVSTGLRCKLRLDSDQFDSSRRATAVEILESMSKKHPSNITSAVLYSLARDTLCKEFHQRQADAKSAEWRAKIEDYVHGRKAKNKDHLHSLPGEESSPRSDLPAGGPNLHPQSKDRDVHLGPVLRAHPASSTTVMVSSLQFERHVAGHLEQLALFALPPPMKESSGASSNQAAASHNSDRTTGSDAISVLSHSSAHTDHGSTPELYAAVTSGDIGRVRQEIQNGADVTLQYGRFGTVLQAAAASLSWPIRDTIFRILLDSGADVNMQAGVYGNALQAVAANPDVDGHWLQAIRILLDRGAEVNASGGRYGHALVAAAAMSTPHSLTQKQPTSRILKILLDHGANPDAQGPKPYGSALHQAIGHKDDESVRLLLDRGASTTVRDEDYGTPVDHAKILAYEPVWQLLQKAALKKNLERRCSRIRLSATLRMQRQFRRRKDSGTEAWSSHPIPPARPIADVSGFTIPPPVDGTAVRLITEKAIALFDFHPENDNELPIRQGQVIQVLQRFGAEREQDDLRARIRKEANIKVGVKNMLEALLQEKTRTTKEQRLKLESELSFCNKKLLLLNSQLEKEVAQSAYQMAEGWIIGQDIESGRNGFVPKDYVQLINRGEGLDNEPSKLDNRPIGDLAPIQDAPQLAQQNPPNREEDYCPICGTSFALMTDSSERGRHSHTTACIESRLLALKQGKGILKVSQPQPLQKNINKSKSLAELSLKGQLAAQAKGKATEGRLSRLRSTINPSARRRKQGLQPHNGAWISSEDRGVALFDFDGNQVGDLSFKRGEVITITKKTENPTDWWIGKIGDRTGIFPSAFVEVFPQGIFPRGQIPDVQKRVHFDKKVGVRVATFSQIEQPSTLYYGVSLEELCQREKRLVPKLITDCIEAVELYGMGLGEVYCDFRTDGNETLTDDLKAEFDQDPESTYLQRSLDPKKIEYVIKLLKDFIWQLPSLLVPRETLARFVRASQIVTRQRIGHFGYENGEGRATTELQAAIRELPPVNKSVFEFLVLHFKRVVDKANQNNMTSDKLAAALAPCFKGGVDSGAGPKLPLVDLTWALEYIIRRGDFWFRDEEKPPDIADDVGATQLTCTVCREDFTLKEATTQEGLRALPCGHLFHHIKGWR